MPAPLQEVTCFTAASGTDRNRARVEFASMSPQCRKTAADILQALVPARSYLSMPHEIPRSCFACGTPSRTASMKEGGVPPPIITASCSVVAAPPKFGFCATATNVSTQHPGSCAVCGKKCCWRK